jgi:H+-transporting ATPase
MPPIGWVWALAVWAYALAWFLVNDRVKLAAYRIFDHGQAALGRSQQERSRALVGAASA